MKQDIELFLRIESYLNGQLDEGQRILYEAEMAQNQALKDRVEASRLANLALMRNKLWEIKNLSATIDQESKKATKTKRIVAVTTGLTMLVAGLAYVMLSEKKPAVIPAPSKTKAIVQIVPSKKAETKIPASKELTTKIVITKKAETNASISTPVTTNNASEHTSPVSPSYYNTNPTPKEDIKSDAVVEKPIIENLCATTNLEVHVQTEKACLNEQNGRIQVSGFRGGKSPYHFKILDENQQNITATQLPAGNYSVVVTDANHCSKTFGGIVVKEEDCRKDYELNASNGETIEIGNASQSTSLSVYDKAGNLYFYKQFAEGEKIYWDGTSSNGVAQSGYFIFMLKQQGGKTKQGSVTVVK